MEVNVLVTLNSNYIKPLRVMLTSLFFNNPNTKFTIYVMHTTLTAEEIEDIGKLIASMDGLCREIKVGDDLFQNAPVLFHYTKEMYFRLLAQEVLPDNIDEILYLDPDILVINSVEELYARDLGENLYGAASHNVISVTEINKLRLFPHEISSYYNSGVLLMNLKLLRTQVDPISVFTFVEENKSKLIMPDQDVLNILYANNILDLDEVLYNYDVRYYGHYKLMSKDLVDMDYIVRNTVFLHFCGKKKPWKKGYSGRFYALYKHYEKLAEDRVKAL